MSSQKELDAMFGEEDEEEVDDNGNAERMTSTSGAQMSDRPPACGLLAFHNGTEEAMLSYVVSHAEKNNPSSVLAAVDAFCYSRHWMMHVGDKKQQVLVDAIDSVQGGVRVAVEIGSYCGYSAIVISTHLDSSAKLFCIEKVSNCVEWTRRLVEFAGLEDRVVVIYGTVSSQSIETVQQALGSEAPPSIDFLFIDHEKSSYRKDLEFIDSLGLLRTGSVVCADNIKSFGIINNEYLSYVKDSSPSGCYSSSTTIDGQIEYVNESDHEKHCTIDAVEVSVHK